MGNAIYRKDGTALKRIRNLRHKTSVLSEVRDRGVYWKTSGSSGGFALAHTLDNPNAYGNYEYDDFGYSVAISNSYAIVGAHSEDDVGGTYSGKAYIYNTSSGELLHTLDNPNPYGTSANDSFGKAVDICESYSIVGAEGEDDISGTTSGKAYIYNNATGNLLYTLDNPNSYGTSTGDSFGYAVSISESYSIVGAYREDEVGNTSSGKAYIYDNTDGSLLYTLNNPNAYSTSASDLFGSSVCISESYAIVGAFGEDDASGSSSGKAYIYSTATGNLLYTLSNPNPYGTSANDFFGYSVSICESYSLVGAYGEDDAGGAYSGRAYIYDNTTGNLLHTLTNPDGTYNDTFGYSVSISESYSIVTADSEENSSVDYTGKVYVFENSTGSLLYTLNNPNPYGTLEWDFFGHSVSICEQYSIVGAFGENENEADADTVRSGKAYIFNNKTSVSTINRINI